MDNTKSQTSKRFACRVFPESITIKRIKQSARIVWRENIVALTMKLTNVLIVALVSRQSMEAQPARHAFLVVLASIHVKNAWRENIVALTIKLTSVSSVVLVSPPLQKVQRARHAFLVVLASTHVKNAWRENIVALTTKLTNVSSVALVSTSL